MSEDTTTREAVERVRTYADIFEAGAHVFIGSESLNTFGMISDLRTILTALDRVTRERDAATTAERDRIRLAVAGMRIVHSWSCQYGVYAAQCTCGASARNAALADVERIIDAEGV